MSELKGLRAYLSEPPETPAVLTEDMFVKNFLEPVLEMRSAPDKILICTYSLMEVKDCPCVQCQTLMGRIFDEG